MSHRLSKGFLYPDCIKTIMHCKNDSLLGDCISTITALRRDEKLCDITIQVENQQFKAHKIILAGSSPYFRAMFAGALEESKQSTVVIHDIPPNVMAILLDYCYSSTIEITQENAQELLPAASILQLNWIRDQCSKFIEKQLDSSNCLGIRSFADTYSCPTLQKSADLYARHHYLDVLDSKEFVDLSVDDLATLLKSDDLNVQNEEQVFDSVMKWVKHDVDNRKNFLANVVRHVRLPLLDRTYLVSKVGTEPLIRHNEDCRDLVDEAKDYLLLPEQRSKLSGPRTRPRRLIRCDEILIAVGGWCSGDAISLVEKYSVSTNEWKVAATMAKRRCGVGVAVFGELLYAIGGHDGSSYLNSMERYDPKMDQWCSNLPPTSSCRTSIGVGILRDEIYAVGGQDGLSCLSSVEKYNPATNQWSLVPAMANRRLGVGVAVMSDCLYAVGGSDGNIPLASVEKYDPNLNQWTEMAPMNCRRKHLGTAVLDNLIYAVGGRDENTELNTVERYDPVSDTWTSVVAMNCRRSGVGLSVVSGKLFAIGGFDGCSYLKSVEWLDVTSNQWFLATNMNYRRLGCGVGVLIG